MELSRWHDDGGASQNDEGMRLRVLAMWQSRILHVVRRRGSHQRVIDDVLSWLKEEGAPPYVAAWVRGVWLSPLPAPDPEEAERRRLWRERTVAVLERIDVGVAEGE